MKYFYRLTLFAVFISVNSFFFSQDKTSMDWSRFTKVVLAEGLDEPMAMDFLPNNEVIVVERKGGVKIINTIDKSVSLATKIDVNTKYVKKGQSREAEEGLMGVTVDPNYAKNNWIYLYYAHPTVTKHVLSRFVYKDGLLDKSTEKVMLEVGTQREDCCHTGGGMVWDNSGNLFLTVGNNTVNPFQGSSNLVDLPGRENEDDQRGPGNTNDLRGKILRIHPEKDGSYTIPKGNLFAEGTPKTRPEIYTMGHRNPWRPSIDSKTGYLYWGEVGPDAQKDSTWGPKGYDEFNQAKGPGFFGWPYFIGNNIPYRSYNAEAKTYGAPFDVNKPQNLSRNNTGLVDLPKPVPAFFWYPYGASEEFPLLGSSGRSATGGPVYHRSDFKNPLRPWPAYFESKWLITEFMRGWIIAVTMDGNGDYVSMEKILPDMNFSSAIDMKFGPTGDLYVLEYGTAWFRGNDNSKLVRIEYNAGNRKPTAVAKADQTAGTLPLKVRFAANESSDADGGKLNYNWTIKNDAKQVVASLKGESPSFTFAKAGNYTAELRVTDAQNASNTAKINIFAGNASPVVAVELLAPNQSFYFDKKPIKYKVKVVDTEDGSTDSQINPEEVAVTFDYIPQGFDPIEIAAKNRTADDIASYAVGKSLIEKSDCKSCHQYNSKSIGPSYVAVAEKYLKNTENYDYLVKKIKEGGSGVWGEHGMSAHPDLSTVNAQRMVDYIFSLNTKTTNSGILKIAGEITPEAPSFERGKANFVLRSAYKDKGNKKVKPILAENKLILKPNILRSQDLDFHKNVQIISTAGYQCLMLGHESWAGFKNLDLTGIEKITAFCTISNRNGAKGARVALRLDNPNGPNVAVSEFLGVQENMPQRPPQGVDPEEFARSRAGKANLVLNKKITGRHNLYFVFLNDKLKSTDVLAQLNDVGFYLV